MYDIMTFDLSMAVPDIYRRSHIHSSTYFGL